MKPLPIDTMVQMAGLYYWVDAVLEEGDNPLYRLRKTCVPGLARRLTTGRHSDLRVCGGILI